jgi:hypothetical protein
MYSSMSKGSRKPPGRLRILENVSKSTVPILLASVVVVVRAETTYSLCRRRARDRQSQPAWGSGRRRAAGRRASRGRRGRCRACRRAGTLRGSLLRPGGCYPWLFGLQSKEREGAAVVVLVWRVAVQCGEGKRGDNKFRDSEEKRNGLCASCNTAASRAKRGKAGGRAGCACLCRRRRRAADSVVEQATAGGRRRRPNSE